MTRRSRSPETGELALTQRERRWVIEHIAVTRDRSIDMLIDAYAVHQRNGQQAANGPGYRADPG